MPELVDVHAHFLTDPYVGAARAAGHRRPDGMPSWPTWSATEHLRLMDGWGIDRSVLSISSPGVHFGDDGAARDLARHVNDAGADNAAAHPRSVTSGCSTAATTAGHPPPGPPHNSRPSTPPTSPPETPGGP